ncbi:BEN domain-containing protein 6-like [Acipenser ruthenus]|uniref:BEN domain-containing protein 6-like n=1 Tax=Acipenser ruthenus TaxID=7906 RepID=UPI00145BD7D8|nr:BEN domain-containing protein 6-like [Acipenser ruthenus]
MRDEETRAQQEVTKNNNDCQGNAITLPAPESEARTPFEMTYSDTESEHEQEQVLKKPKPDIAIPAPSSVNILTQLKLSLEKEQKEQNSPPDGESEGEGEDEDLLHHKSKEDLIAEIKILRAKLARSTRETCRLRQSLTMLRVLPKAVKKFTKLVDKAEELLKVPLPPGSQHAADSGAPAAAPPSPSPSSSTSSLLSSLSPAGSRISSSSLFSSPESPVREGAKPPQKKWFKIEKWQIDRFNKATPQKFVNDLMQARYTMEFMATHSVTGARSSSSKFRETKPAMNRAEVQEIIDVTKRLFPDMTDTIVRRMMGQKLNNCTKKYLSTKFKVEIVSP